MKKRVVRFVDWNIHKLWNADRDMFIIPLVTCDQKPVLRVELGRLMVEDSGHLPAPKVVDNEHAYPNCWTHQLLMVRAREEVELPEVAGRYLGCAGDWLLFTSRTAPVLEKGSEDPVADAAAGSLPAPAPESAKDAGYAFGARPSPARPATLARRRTP